MKRTNKYLSLALAIIMALSLCVTSFAANDGVITLNNASNGETYALYKIFDATYTTVGDAKAAAYTYTKTAETDEVYNALTAAGSPFTLAATTQTGVYNVTLTDNATTGEAVATFLKDNIIGKLTAVQTKPASEATVEFTGLAYGYYYISSSLGSLVTIDTTTPNATVYEKNSIPTITKEVKEDSTGVFGPWATAEINQEVEFKLEVDTGKNDYNVQQPGTGANQSYIITDEIPAGMEYVDESMAVVGATGFVVEEIEGTNDIKITMTADQLPKGENAKITLTYKAKVLNTVAMETALVNKATLDYSGHTSVATATVYTLNFDVFKYTGANKTALPTAEFVVKKVVEETTYYAKTSVAVAAEDGTNVYTFDQWVTDKTQATTFVSPANGKFMINGLDADTYLLEETKAPEGYNLVAGDYTITLTAKYNEEKKVVEFADHAVTTTEVENNIGTVLPSTGGVGTTMFYVLGSVMMIGAAVLLVTKKKMTNEQ